MARQLLLALLGVSAVFTVLAQQPYQNASLSTEQRVDDLLARMTLEEKVAQLQTVWQQRRGMENQQQQFLADKAAQVIPLGIGHIGRPSEFKTPQQTAEFNNEIGRAHV